MTLVCLTHNAKRQNRKKMPALSIETTINEIALSIENSIPIIPCRFNKFLDAYNVEFPLTINTEDRGRADAISWALMDGPLVLYALGLNGSAIVELYDIFERFALRETAYLLSSPSNRLHIKKVLERRSLSEIIRILFDLEVISKEDVKFVTRLNNLRNGLAHKNPKVISNLVLSGKNISFLDIDSLITEVDCIPYIIGIIRLLIKLSKREREPA